jgi:hypothetical protein
MNENGFPRYMDEIVKQQGGYILARREPGKGSTFKTYFPRINYKDIRLKIRQALTGKVREMLYR